MPMQRSRKHFPSPNFAPNEIPVEFLVLHYTACPLTKVLEIFGSREMKTCAHFVIDLNGDLYDLGAFWDGPILQGAHAGESRWQAAGKCWEKLNTCSIGVEIVNLNGNLFPYTNAQYETLKQLTRHLQGRFPALTDPERVLGHEQIAGFRGKVDPGLCFDWARFFGECYTGKSAPRREAELTPPEAAELSARVAAASEAERADTEFWTSLSTQLEREAKARRS
jgi:N-acetyl-anhydromuramyl-L-alanine amidase AmpD